DGEQTRRMRRVGIEVAGVDVYPGGGQTALGPFDFFFFFSLAQDRGAAPPARIIKLFEGISGRGQSFSFTNLPAHAVHANVAGEIEIQAATFDIRPGPDFLILRVVDRIALDHRDFALPDPVAIKIAFDAPAAADVRGAELFAGFFFVFLLVYGLALRR